MVMPKRNREAQHGFWIPAEDLPQSPGHPFCERVTAILETEGSFIGVCFRLNRAIRPGTIGGLSSDKGEVPLKRRHSTCEESN